jgi:hypothetical protein
MSLVRPNKKKFLPRRSIAVFFVQVVTPSGFGYELRKAVYESLRGVSFELRFIKYFT